MLDDYRSAMAQITTKHPLFWLMFEHHVHARGGAMSYADKPYMIAVMAALPKLEEAVISKCVQTGFSELFLAYSLWRAGWSGRRIAYVLPQFAGRKRYVQSRFDPLVDMVPAYRLRAGLAADRARTRGGGAAKSVDNISFKNFGTGVIFFLSSATDADFVELSVDTLIIDEYDLCDANNLSKADDRLAASPYPQKLMVGNPDLPNRGIDGRFQASNRQFWFHQCNRCGERQPIDWETNMVRKSDSGIWVPRDTERAEMLAGYESAPKRHMDIRPVCRKCQRPFDRRSSGGRWVSTNPSRHLQGWTTNRLDDLSTNAWKLYLKWLAIQGDSAEIATFQKSNLGRAAELGGVAVTVEALDGAVGEHFTDDMGGAHLQHAHVICGVDVGAKLHVEIAVLTPALNADGTPDDYSPMVRESIFVTTVPSFDVLKDLMTRYCVDCVAVDAMPETHSAQEFRDWCNNETDTACWLVRFHVSQVPRKESYGFARDYRTHVTVVDRTQLLDATLDDIKNGAQTFPADIMSVPDWSAQMRNMVRVVDESKGRIVWDNDGKPDHYRFANAYLRVAQDLLFSGPRVLT